MNTELDVKQAVERRKRMRRRKKLAVRILLCTLGVIVVIACSVLAAAKIMMYTGRNSLRSKGSQGPQFGIDSTEEAMAGYKWQDGWVRYNGDVYAYNEDIMTFLVMGIDKDEAVTDSSTLTDGGQSDAIFLVIINPHDKSIKIYAIDRNTMTDITMEGMGADGSDITTTAQIAVQHGFGDGRQGSCELTVNAVSALMYNLPIHGYISINYGALASINDAVGGVEVTIPEDMAALSRQWNVNWKAGDVVNLKGEEAMTYIRARDPDIFESARLRTLRQKTYLTAFVNKAMSVCKEDITMPVTLFNKIKRYTVTDISVDEITYLASELIGYHFSGEQIYTMSGETVMGEYFEEFYPDMDELKKQMIDIFYEKVDTDS